MADESVTTETKLPAPVVDQIAAKPEVATKSADLPKPDPGPVAPQSAKERLRAFEDANFGPDVVRINGEIERGRGSPFAEMTDDKRKHYQVLENLIAAEQKLADASAALASAEADHEAAKAAVAAREADASAES
jgi:hypothetical protein